VQALANPFDDRLTEKLRDPKTRRCYGARQNDGDDVA
jgi:hypothetical protein